MRRPLATTITKMPFLLSYPIRSLAIRRHRSAIMIVGIALAVTLPLVINISFDSTVGAAYRNLTQSIPDDVRLMLPPASDETILKELADFVANSSPTPIDTTLRFYGDSMPVRTNSSSYHPSDLVAVNVQRDWFQRALERDSGDTGELGGNWCFVSHALASELHLTLNSSVEVYSRHGNLNLRVTVVFHRLGFEDEKLTVVDLSWLHASWNTSLVNEVGIILAAQTIDVDEYATVLSSLVGSLNKQFDNPNMRLERLAILERAKATIEVHRQSMSLMSLLSLMAGAAGTTAFIVLAYHEQLREASLLKVVGLKGHQLVLPPLIMTTVLVLCGSLLAIPISIPASWFLLASGGILSVMPNTATAMYAAEPALRLLPRSVLAPIVVLLAVSLMTAVYPAAHSAKVPCVVGLRPRVRQGTTRVRNRAIPIVGGIGLTISFVLFRFFSAIATLTLEERNMAFPLLIVLLMVSAMLLSLALIGPLSHIARIFAPYLHGLEQLLTRNLVRNVYRSWSMSCQFAVGVLVVIMLSSMVNALQGDAVANAYSTNGSDIALSGYHPPSVVSSVMQLDDVECASSLMYFDTSQTKVNGVSTIESEGEIRSWFIEPVNYSRTCRWEWLDRISEPWLSSLEGFTTTHNVTIVSKQVADRFHVSAGDSVRIEIGYDGEYTVFNRSCLVLAVVASVPGLGDLYTPIVVLSTRDLENGLTGLIGERLLVRTTDESTEIEQVAERILEELPEGFVMTVSITRVLIGDYLKQWSSFLLVYDSLASFSLVVAGVTLIVVMMASVVERRFEFGIFRSIGVPQIQRFVIAESLIIGMIGFGMGIMFSIILLSAGVLQPASSTSAAPPLAWNAVIVVFVVVLGIALLAGLVSSRYLRSEMPVASLRKLSQ